MTESLTLEDLARLLPEPEVQAQLEALLPGVKSRGCTRHPFPDGEPAFSITVDPQDGIEDGAVLQVEVAGQKVPVIVRVAMAALTHLGGEVQSGSLEELFPPDHLQCPTTGDAHFHRLEESEPDAE